MTLHAEVFLLYTAGMFRIRQLPDTPRRAKMRVLFSADGGIGVRKGWHS